jgi:hypothetical protein
MLYRVRCAAFSGEHKKALLRALIYAKGICLNKNEATDSKKQGIISLLWLFLANSSISLLTS